MFFKPGAFISMLTPYGFHAFSRHIPRYQILRETLSCLIQGLTIEEAVLGITRHAARALGQTNSGVVQVGRNADIALFAPPPGEPATVESLIQHMGSPNAVHVFCRGVQVF